MPRARSQLMSSGVPSMDTSRAIAAGDAGARSRGAPRLARSRRSQDAPERVPGHVGVVEGQDPAADLLAVSWPLPAMTTTSPGPALARAVAMASARSARRHLAGPAAAGHDLVDDASGILAAGVVGGHDGQVGQLGCGRAHQRPLVVVPVAAGAEDHEQPAAGQLPGRGEGLRRGRRGCGRSRPGR